jgi:hypothetical protein
MIKYNSLQQISKEMDWVAKFSVADPDLFWSDPVKIRPDPQHATPAK